MFSSSHRRVTATGDVGMNVTREGVVGHQLAHRLLLEWHRDLLQLTAGRSHLVTWSRALDHAARASRPSALTPIANAFVIASLPH
jgi:hypothetical protein